MQKRGTSGNAKRGGSQIDVGATRIAGKVNEEQYGMENKGETRGKRRMNEERASTSASRTKSSEKLRENSWLNEKERERKRRRREKERENFVDKRERALSREGREGERVRGSQLPPHSYTHDDGRTSVVRAPSNGEDGCARWWKVTSLRRSRHCEQPGGARHVILRPLQLTPDLCDVSRRRHSLCGHSTLGWSTKGE